MKKYKNRFCYGRKNTIDSDKKKRLLLVPLIFIVLLYVPVMIYDIIPIAYIQELPEVLRTIFWLILCISVGVWCTFFYYIPIGVYIAILVVYTVVSWRWILRRKKGNAMYSIVWFVLCVSLILMYWKWGPEYYSIINI